MAQNSWRNFQNIFHKSIAYTEAEKVLKLCNYILINPRSVCHDLLIPTELVARIFYKEMKNKICSKIYIRYMSLFTSY